MSDFLEKALAILIENKNLNEVEVDFIRKTIEDLITYLNIGDLDEDEKTLLLGKIKKANINTTTNAGMYVATVITGNIVQANLDAIHSFGKSNTGEQNVKFSGNDFIDFSRGSDKVYIKVKLFDDIPSSAIPDLGKYLVGVHIKDIIKYGIHNPVDKMSLATHKNHRYKIAFDLDKMKSLQLSMNEVNAVIIDYVIRRSGGKGDITIYSSDDKLGVYYFYFDFYLNQKPDYNIEKDLNNILVRGHKIIKDMLIQSLNGNYEIIFKTSIKPGSEKKYWLKSKALKILYNHPFIEKIVDINHGLVYDNFFGVLQTYYKFIELQSRGSKKYKDVYVKILILLQTITGSITSIKMASSSFVDSITQSTKGKALTKLALSLENKLTNKDLTNFTYLFIFGELKTPAKYTDEMKETETNMFGNTEVGKVVEYVRTKLYNSYDYTNL